jgi:CTP:molybdopterin cytidylyltransferase MocA
MRMAARSPAPTGILLAAGASTRMGSPKALREYDGVPAIRRVTGTLLAGGCDRVVVVLGADEESIRPAVPDRPEVTVVVNELWERGRTGSLRAALRATRDAPAWILHPVDHPLVIPEDVRALIAAWVPSETPLVRPVHEGRGGHPILLDAMLREDLLALGDDEPLRDLLRNYRCRERRVSGSPGTIQNLDTPEDRQG